MTGIIPGQPNGANEVMNAFGSNFNDTAQMIFNSDYLGFDSRLSNSGTPILKNMDYDTFTSDTATTSTNFTYDSTNDLYFGDTGEIIATLIVPFDDSDSTITNIISIINDKNLKSFQDNILEASFETDINWTFSETAGTWSGVIVADPKTGTNAYKLAKGTTDVNGTHGQILQSNIDLTDVDKIGLWAKGAGDNVNNIFLEIIIDSTVVLSVVRNSLSGTYSFKQGDIPSELRTTGKDITIRIIQNGPGANATEITFDDINIWSSTTESTKTYEISLDNGSNFETINKIEISRPLLTGTQPQLKVIHTQTNGTFIGTIDLNTITEEAIKFNFY